MDRRLKEEFLTCIVCHEVFRDPVTLHCGHTFCSDCVTAYTRTQHHAVADQCIPCPHCRAFTKVPHPQQATEKWAGQIKTSFFVKGLVDAFVSTEEEKNLCTPCNEDGEKTKASVWCTDCRKALCTTCQKFHRKLMPSHPVSDLTERKTQEFEKVEEKILCEKHRETVVDMMCQKCDVAVCPRCCIENHKSCMDSVVTMTEALPNINCILEERQMDLQDNIEILQKEIPHLESQMKNLQVNTVKTEAEISFFSQKVAAHVSTSLKDQLQELTKEAMDHLQNDVASARECLLMAQQNQSLVKEVLKTDSEKARYEVYKTCPRKGETVGVLTTAPRMLEFKLKQDIESEEMGRLCKIVPAFDQRHCISQMSKGILIESIFAALETDTKPPQLNDVLVMEVNNTIAIVMTDQRNSRVKCFYKIGSKNKKSYLQIQNPRGLTTTTNTKAAVAVPELNKIVTFTVTPDLVLDKTITTQKPYFDICFLAPAKFVALGFETGDVDIIDLSGNILRSLCPGSFAKPGRVCLKDPNTFLVADTKQRKIKAISDQGEHVFVYGEHLSFPRGLAKSTSGEYFVNDGNSSKVIQFSDTGHFVREVLTLDQGIQKPSGLFVDKTNRMYVATDTGYVHVYAFM